VLNDPVVIAKLDALGAALQPASPKALAALLGDTTVHQS